MNLSAQSYVKQFPGDDRGVCSAKIWHLDEDHYYLFRTESKSDIASKHNHLQIIEYDYCGVVQTHEIYFDQLWSTRISGEIFEEGDTLRIPVRSNPSPNGPNYELGLISMHKYNFSGRYQYLRAESNFYNLSIRPYRDSFYLLHGFISYTTGPIAAAIFIADRNFNVMNYYQYYHARTAIGSIQAVGNDFYLFSGKRLTKLDANLEPMWTKTKDHSVYMRKSFRVKNGFLLTLTKTYGGRQFVLEHVDFNGEVKWVSENLLMDLDQSYIPNAFQSSSGDIYMIRQKIQNGVPDGMVISILEESSGKIKSQWELADSYASLMFTDFLVEDQGGSLLALDSLNNAYVFKYSLTDSLNCFLQETVDFSETVDSEFRDTINFPNVIRTFQPGSFEFVSEEVNSAVVENICQDELPKFDLLPDQFLNCGQKSIEADLTAIPFTVNWSDGFQGRLREFSEPGKYSYDYEVCDELYGEELVVKNEPCPCDWYVPNIFSPNADGNNDEFRVFNSCAEITEFSIQIFNRWGGLMYTADRPDFLWDGTWRGKYCASGVYTYLLYYRDILSGEPRQREQGSIILLR